jgi:hypothetical protein
MRKIIVGVLLVTLLFIMSPLAYADKNRGEYSTLDLIMYWIRLEFIDIESKKLTDYMHERILYWQEQIKIDRPILEKDTQINQGRG